MIDINEQLLSNIITLPLLWIALIMSISHKFTSAESAIAGAAAGYLVVVVHGIIPCHLDTGFL